MLIIIVISRCAAAKQSRLHDHVDAMMGYMSELTGSGRAQSASTHKSSAVVVGSGSGGDREAQGGGLVKRHAGLQLECVLRAGGGSGLQADDKLALHDKAGDGVVLG